MTEPSTAVAPTKGRSQVMHFLLLCLGPIAAVTLYFLVPIDYLVDGKSQQLDSAGRATLAMMAWMSLWWLTEATDITTTALLPLALFPVFRVTTLEMAAGPYADKLVFLFLGGFLLALSMQRWGLGKRVALLTLSIVGTQPRMMVAGFMLITALFSAFVSNVATVAMMLPIALSVIRLFESNDTDGHESRSDLAALHSQSCGGLATCLLLAIAYSASIGGLATIIGTPPNVFMVGFLADMESPAMRVDISFLDWMKFGVPLAAILLFCVWVLLTWILFRLPKALTGFDRTTIARWLRQLGPVRRGEWVTAIVFGATILLWVFRPVFNQLAFNDWKPLSGFSDTGIVLMTALVLFLIPESRCGKGKIEFVMDWHTAKDIPWNVLLLFGGGLSLAAAVSHNHVAEYLGSQLYFLSNQPAWLVVLVVTSVVVFATELTSNTATTAALVPVLAALAPVVGMHPAVLVIATGLSASCAFMLPVATPPNAIIYGSGHIEIRQMIKAGFWINLIAIGVITSFVLWIIPWLLLV